MSKPKHTPDAALRGTRITNPRAARQAKRNPPLAHEVTRMSVGAPYGSAVKLLIYFEHTTTGREMVQTLRLEDAAAEELARQLQAAVDKRRALTTALQKELARGES